MPTRLGGRSFGLKTAIALPCIGAALVLCAAVPEAGAAKPKAAANTPASEAGKLKNVGEKRDPGIGLGERRINAGAPAETRREKRAEKRDKRGEPESLPSDVPPIAVPPGYGRYCSLLYPSGSSSLLTSADTRSNPCAVTAATKPTISRAGLWSVNGWNSILARCGAEVASYRQLGIVALTEIAAWAKDKKGCVFVVAPATLPIFGRPYGKSASETSPDDNVESYSGFDFARLGKELDVRQFGQKGKRSAVVNHLGAPANGLDDHDAHDWKMPLGKPILAAAAGLVRVARWRDVTGICADPSQSEIYIEHLVDGGQFEERFVTYYAHMDTMTVKDGQVVTLGQVIGTAGTRGCSSAPHLHFGVTRLTNLTAKRFHRFEVTPGGHGDNAYPYRIEPYGWAAPAGVDPWGSKYIGTFPDGGDTYVDPGAFSINLWLPGEAPPAPNW